MQPMSPSPVETADLLDLKLLPAWVKEPAEPRRYADTEGDYDRERPTRHHRGKPRHGRNRSSLKVERGIAKRGAGHERNRVGLQRGRHREADRRRRDVQAPIMRSPEVAVRFLPYSPAFENVVAQIKSGSVAYSLFALARLFLEKPIGYEVYLTAKTEAPLYQLGEQGVVSVDREFLERNAFRFGQRDFYQTEVVETEPIKGNFSNVARCRLSGTLLGPTNHHNYQPQLRSLYEQRFSRRMSFVEYQRQIEIVSDASAIERWKEEARKLTTYTTLREETPLKFSSVAEAERHFRLHYLPGFIRNLEEVTISGALSRNLPDRALNRTIEEAWARETHSPSNTMQELATRFRQNGLYVFRHRRGMLFVSPIRPRAFVHEHAGVSPPVNAILEAISAAAGINRKQLLEKLISDGASEHAEPRRLALASDLHWLINEGYVIEFNDGSLDLPRGKTRPQQNVEAVAETVEEPLITASSAAEPIERLLMQAPLQLTWREP
jgi:hypothetical protein